MFAAPPTEILPEVYKKFPCPLTEKEIYKKITILFTPEKKKATCSE